MQIRLPGHLARQYKSLSQQTRAVTELWGEENFYCLNCPSPRLDRTPHGTKGVDYICPRCQDTYQLKGQSRPLAGRIPDAAYKVMLGLIRTGRPPHLFALHYDRAAWTVTNLVLVPSFAFTESAIEKRAPLSPSARRHGWVGCTIVLANIPPDARVLLVLDGEPQNPGTARKLYARLRPLQNLPLESRGWRLDVLNVVRKLNKREFTLDEVYQFATELSSLHPQNRHVEPKIRQQLQRLRDLEFLDFVSPGHYRLSALGGPASGRRP